ncbi:pentapeptide repeat-containing protein [Amycolatopsis rhizosphaerae]|uniref:Pentapeptide repeat-containing protein n=1 Tax=Amycolatopsis rhizosphaerae TaxID=2053003 RepID=A0A558CWA6_9PSEU|nr:pentapeptide repeat-containing protein [Amycolatopsis rhizosphaerae]
MIVPVPGKTRDDLRADCSRCFALCCVVPAFSASSDFAVDKPPGTPCANLRPDFRCSIHDRLRERGFPGCTVYDCFGAGQKVAQVTFGGRDWRQAPEEAERMFAVFPVLRDLLWYLHHAASLPGAAEVHSGLERAFAETERLTLGEPGAILAVDVAAQRRKVNALLVRASELVRGKREKANLRGEDLIGRDFRKADLTAANLRGTRLLGADLREAVLRLADLTGADLRGADLRGADLSTTLFLTQAQLDAARGDRSTRIPETLARPSRWNA